MIDGATRASYTQHRLIHRWIDAREELMGLFARLTDQPRAHDIEDFRSALMDYVCAGHFGVYEHVIEDMPTTPESRTLLSGLYLAIHDTTKAALAFDDICTVPQSADELTPLLADLGLRLEERFLLEDQLIEACIAEPALAD
jgi:regulator of sigma D